MTLTFPRPEVDRHIAFESIFNFRDLGGYATVDGGRIRWRRLFRADALGRLTEADAPTVAALGLRTVLDLRTRREIDSYGAFPIHRHRVHYHHLPIIDSTWDPNRTAGGGTTAEFLHGAYTDMLNEGSPVIAKAFAVLAQPRALPAVFHCAVGKDRTGLLAALVLGGLEVADDDIVADYSLTARAMGHLVAWTRQNDPKRAAQMATIPPAFLAADPTAMKLVLDDLRRDHGSVREFLRSIGVGATMLDQLRTAVVE